MKELLRNKIRGIALILLSVSVIVFISYNVITPTKGYPSEIRVSSVVQENDTFIVLHTQKYRLVTIGVDTIYKKKRVKSTLEYER